jgi:hypothetical protein
MKNEIVNLIYRFEKKKNFAEKSKKHKFKNSSMDSFML